MQLIIFGLIFFFVMRGYIIRAFPVKEACPPAPMCVVGALNKILDPISYSFLNFSLVKRSFHSNATPVRHT